MYITTLTTETEKRELDELDESPAHWLLCPQVYLCYISVIVVSVGNIGIETLQM